MINLPNTTGAKSKKDRIGQSFMFFNFQISEHNASLLVFRKQTTTPHMLQDKSFHVPY